MTLKEQLNKSLLSIEEKIGRAENASNKALELIKSFSAKEIINDELVRTFALKRRGLEDLNTKLLSLVSLTKAIKNHIEIISMKEASIKRALEILEKHEDRYINFTAEIQAISIFLENRLKEL